MAAGDLYTFFLAAGLVLDTHLSFIVSFSNANICSTKYENHYPLEFLDDPLMILLQAISIKSYSFITFLLRPYLSTCGPMADITPKMGKNVVAMMTIWVSTSLFFRNSHSEISKSPASALENPHFLVRFSH